MMYVLYFISGMGLGYFIKDIINIYTSKRPRKKSKNVQPIKKENKDRVFQIYLKMPKVSNGFVSKRDLIIALMNETKLSRAQVYRIYDEEKHLFEETKIGRGTYLREME